MRSVRRLARSAGLTRPGLAFRYRLRAAVNLVNGSTMLGWFAAHYGDAILVEVDYGMQIAQEYTGPMAGHAAAVCIGNVVLTKHPADHVLARDGFLRHESLHATQWAIGLGPLGFLPAYLLASAWSWIRSADTWSDNVFELHAGLADGGYTRNPRRAAVAR